MLQEYLSNNYNFECYYKKLQIIQLYFKIYHNKNIKDADNNDFNALSKIFSKYAQRISISSITDTLKKTFNCETYYSHSKDKYNYNNDNDKILHETAASLATLKKVYVNNSEIINLIQQIGEKPTFFDLKDLINFIIDEKTINPLIDL